MPTCSRGDDFHDEHITVRMISGGDICCPCTVHFGKAPASRAPRATQPNGADPSALAQRWCRERLLRPASTTVATQGISWLINNVQPSAGKTVRASLLTSPDARFPPNQESSPRTQIGNWSHSKPPEMTPNATTSSPRRRRNSRRGRTARLRGRMRFAPQFPTIIRLNMGNTSQSGRAHLNSHSNRKHPNIYVRSIT